jgi:hypothetical protein
MNQDATAWFDQFKPLDTTTWTHNQWCPRHWAPCPVFGANGIGAAVELLQAFVGEFAVSGSTPEQLNRQMQRISPICCTLGDERMYELWGHWPPKGAASVANTPPVMWDQGSEDRSEETQPDDV